MLPKFEPELFVRAIRDSGGTSSFVVPTMISKKLSNITGLGFDQTWNAYLWDVT